MSEINKEKKLTFHLDAAAKYNPQLWSADELRAIFVARQRELKIIIEAIANTDDNEVPQHLLITGQRGMGKSTLLHRVALAIEDDAVLSKKWLALRFPEEQYTVSTLAEFWANVLDALADALERNNQDNYPVDLAVQSIAILPIEQREEAATNWLETWCNQQQLRLVLLVDSTDMLLSNLAAGNKKNEDTLPLWSLRKTLQHKKYLFWLGGSYLALESSTLYQDAFLDFFHSIELKPLSLQEMQECLLRLARVFGSGRELTGEAAVVEMQRAFANRPERLKVLRGLTGGNPRTTVMLYELFAAGGEDNVRADLERLLDSMTPLYKAKMEALAEQPRKILAYIMEYWFPISLRELAESTSLATNILSPQLKRLEGEDGLIERVKLPNTTRNGYQVAERFFNIWYLMRNAPRRLRMRLMWLIEFMRLWYSNSELEDLANKRVSALQHRQIHSLDDLEYSRAVANALTDDSTMRHQLEWSIFCQARQQREQLSQLFDLSGEDKPYLTSDDYLTRLEKLSVQLVRCPYLETDTQKENFVRLVKGSLALTLADKEAVAAKSYDLSEWQYSSLIKILEEERQKFEDKYAEVDFRYIESLVLKGEFFPDMPNSKLAYQQIKMNFKEPETLVFVCDLFALRFQDKYVENCYRYAIEIGVNTASFFNNWGNLLQDYLHSYEEAEIAYRQAIAIDKNYAYPWNGLGNVLQYHLGRYVESEEAYRQAIVLDKNYASPWNNLGNLLKNHLGRYEEAEEAYRQAIVLDKNYASPWNGLGNVLQGHLGRYVESEEAYRQAIVLDKNYASPWNNLGNLLKNHLGRYEEAEEAYRQAIVLDKNYASPWNGLGNVLQYHLGRYVESEEAYRQAIALGKNDAYPWNGLGNLLKNHLGRYVESEEAYRQAIVLDKNYAYPWNGLGNLLQDHLGRYVESEEAYRQAIALDKNDASPWNGLGNLLQGHLGRYVEAEEAYRQATVLDKNYAYPWNGLGNLLQGHLGRYVEAEEAYRQAIVLDKNYAYPWNGLGNLLQDHLGRYEEAIQAYQEAMEIDATDRYVIGNLARLYVRLNQPEQALCNYRLLVSQFKELEPNLALQAHLYLQNKDLAMQALLTMAEKASSGQKEAFYLLKEQAVECSAIRLAEPLAQLMEQSPYAGYLQPFSVALRVFSGQQELLDGLAPEVEGLVEDIVKSLKEVKK